MSTDEVTYNAKISYSIPNFAKVVDLSVEKVRQHIDSGELVPSYVDSKPLIMHEEGLRWLRARPAERPKGKK